MFAVCTAALGMAMIMHSADKPNFSGTWKLNPAKSNYGPVPVPDKMERKIVHNDPTLKMTTTQSGPQGEITTDITYKTDGSESTNQIRGAEVKSIAKWDGDALTVSSKREIQGNEMQFNERWTLGEGGKVLTVVNKISGAQGDFEVTIVLEKQ
jgi:hypothetical protein